MRGSTLVCLLAVCACSQPLTEERPDPTLADAGPLPDGVVFPDAAPLAPLAIDYADPDHGPFVGGTEVTLRGRGFKDGMVVTFGGRRVQEADLEILDSHRAVVKTPAGDPGGSAIHVTAGSNEATREGGYLYEPIYLEPGTGATSGGTYVRLRGLGTAFKATDVITLDGQSLTGVQIINGQELVGYTPPGISGLADLRVVSAEGETLFAAAAFSYQASVTPFQGGFGGGPINGSVSVNVIDSFTGDGVPNATVVIGDPLTSPFSGTADLFGQITFSAPELRGPIVLTAGHKKYETGALVGFDARDVTIFLQPVPDPTEMPPDLGPFGPGRQPGTVSGDIVFGGSTGLGTTDWDLVPEPRTETEVKRTYVFTTTRDIFTGSVDPGPGGTIDYQAGQDSWHYSIPVRPTAFALVAVAGLYEPNLDPDGSGPLPRGVFTPYAMGVKRNVLIGPDEDKENQSIAVNIPLDTGIKVVLKDVPEVAAKGPDEYRVNALIDLGGEGVIRLPGGRSVFNAQKSTIMTGLAPLAYAISDASYTVVAGAYTANKPSPYSVRIVRGVRDLSKPIGIDGFVGVPHPSDPIDGGSTTLRHLVLAPYGGGALPTFYEHRLRTLKRGDPVWHVIGRGSLAEMPLYDLSVLGLPTMTKDDLYWTVYGVSVRGGDFDTFNYGQTNANTWSAYSYDTATVSFE